MSNNHSQRYKLYKAGKLWVTSLIIISGAFFVQTTNASANDDTPATTVNTSQAAPNNSTACQATSPASQTANSANSSVSQKSPAAFDNDYDLDLESRYHIFTKKVTINADCNGNIAADEYTEGNEFGTRNESHNNTEQDYYYLHKVDSIGSNGFRRTNTRVVFGKQVKYKIEGNTVYINGVKQDQLRPEDILPSRDAIDFESEFHNLENISDRFSAHPQTDGVKFDFHDMNNRIIDLSHVDPNTKIIYVDIDAKYLTCPQQLVIKGLSQSEDGPMVIFNVINAGKSLSWQTKSMLNYGKDSQGHEIWVSPSESHAMPNHILWNFGTGVSGDLNISGYLLGSVLAPDVNLATSANADGNLIAKTVLIGGESHRWDLHVIPDAPIPVNPHDNWNFDIINHNQNKGNHDSHNGNQHKDSSKNTPDQKTPNNSTPTTPDQKKPNNSTPSTPDQKTPNTPTTKPNSDQPTPEDPANPVKPSTDITVITPKGNSIRPSEDHDQSTKAEQIVSLENSTSTSKAGKRLPQTGNSKSWIAVLLGFISLGLTAVMKKVKY